MLNHSLYELGKEINGERRKFIHVNPLLICIYSDSPRVRPTAACSKQIPVLFRTSVFVKPECLRFSLKLF